MAPQGQDMTRLEERSFLWKWSAKWRTHENSSFTIPNKWSPATATGRTRCYVCTYAIYVYLSSVVYLNVIYRIAKRDLKRYQSIERFGWTMTDLISHFPLYVLVWYDMMKQSHSSQRILAFRTTAWNVVRIWVNNMTQPHYRPDSENFDLFENQLGMTSFQVCEAWIWSSIFLQILMLRV